ncbi:MAG: GTPase Era [Thermoanaerobaculia bacterium]
MKTVTRRSGTVAVVGRPNSGKSTLVNALVGRKIAIVSDKPQTTRRRVLGIRNTPGGQIVFVDTPGLHKPLYRLNKVMMDEALEAIREVDLRVLVVDAAVPEGNGDRWTAELLAKGPRPNIVLLNKIDGILEKSALLPRMASLAAAGAFEEIVPISALTGEGLEELPGLFLRYLPEGDDLYPSETLTTTDERTRWAEIIREKFLERAREEIPYGLGVVVDEVGRDEAKNLTVVMATVVVDKESHRRIVIGAGGRVLRDSGAAARRELEQTFGGRFFLDLTVAARPGWREDARFVASLTS